MPSPVISAVIAAYQIEEYADALFSSIERQSVTTEILEVIIVDDGSTDNTGKISKVWAQNSRFNVRVVSQSNAGVAAARNRGIDLARGEWIAFVDSDDVLDGRYFESLVTFIERDSNESASMLTSRSVIFNEEKGIAQDVHPLGWKYRKGDRLVSLQREPHVIHLGGHSTIVRTDVVRENDLRFSSLVKPAFEDAHFIGRYLACFQEPVIGLVASARYFYRKRANGSSLIDTTWTKPEKFTHEPKYGHLDLLSTIKESYGHVPVWAQNMVLYSLYWYFRADRQLNSPLRGVDPKLFDDFWDTLYKIFDLIDEDVIRQFNLVNYGWSLKEGILQHFKGRSLDPSLDKLGYMWNADDLKRKTRKLGYTYVGPKPQETIKVDGKKFTNAVSKSIRHVSFGRTLMFEQVVILPRAQHVEIFLNDEKIRIVKPIQAEQPDFTFKSNPPKLQLSAGRYVPNASEVVREAKRAAGVNKLVLSCRAAFLKVREEALINGVNPIISSKNLGKRLVTRSVNARSASVGVLRDKQLVRRSKDLDSNGKYHEAWIIMDHPNRADDNGEHFYRYVRSNHPKINSFFMLKPDSSDWDRLQSEGFSLVAYGSKEAAMLTLNAKYIISSHIDAGIYDPVSRKRFGPSPARRIFLQHGMVMNDLSRWLNTKGLALMVSSSPMEYDHFVGDGSTYKFTSKEVVLTGLPRHDYLVRNSRNPKSDRKYLTFVPTWRQSLVNKLKSASSKADQRAILHQSSFYLQWKRVVSSSKMRDLAQRSGLEIVFILHDHLSAFEDLFDFADHVVVSSFKNFRIQDLLLSSRVLVTDYSSIATEAMIAKVPVAYFQFDRNEMFSGGHTFEEGWFDYETHGFGPVFQYAIQLEKWLRGRSVNGWEASRIYETRLKNTLPTLDGNSSARVYEAIEQLDNPLFDFAIGPTSFRSE